MKRVHADLAHLPLMRIMVSERCELHSASGTSGGSRGSCPRANVLLHHSLKRLSCHPEKGIPVGPQHDPARVLRFQVNPTAEIQWPWSTPSAGSSLRRAGCRQLHHQLLSSSLPRVPSRLVPTLFSLQVPVWRSFLGERICLSGFHLRTCQDRHSRSRGPA